MKKFRSWFITENVPVSLKSRLLKNLDKRTKIPTLSVDDKIHLTFSGVMYAPCTHEWREKSAQITLKQLFSSGRVLIGRTGRNNSSAPIGNFLPQIILRSPPFEYAYAWPSDPVHRHSGRGPGSEHKVSLVQHVSNYRISGVFHATTDERIFVTRIFASTVNTCKKIFQGHIARTGSAKPSNGLTVC